MVVFNTHTHTHTLFMKLFTNMFTNMFVTDANEHAAELFVRLGAS